MSDSTNADRRQESDPGETVEERDERLECQLDGDDLPIEEDGYGYGV